MCVCMCVCVCYVSNITNDGEIVSEVNARLGKAARAFSCLRSSIFDNRVLTYRLKGGVYHAVVMSTYTLLYGSETCMGSEGS